MSRIKKVGALMLAFITLCYVCISTMKVNAAEQGLKERIVILHTNDSHGRVQENMGFSSVAALKESYEKEGATVLLLDAGDTLHGLPFATIDQGESIVKLMNIAGYDAMVPGNHDFNYGSDRLLELRKMMNFELVSSNVTKKADGSNFLSPYTIINRDGITFGIFGLSTPETVYKTNPDNVSSLAFGDPIQSAKDMVALLKEKKVDKIIALSHLGTDLSSEVTSEQVAKKVKGIDLIVDGHSHTTYKNGHLVNGTMIVSTGEYLTNIGVVEIQGDSVKASLVNSETFQGKSDAIDALIAQINQKQDVILSEVVASTSVVLDGERETNRTSETNLGNLATDAMVAMTGADLAITNGGGIRASIDKGEITRKELITVFPFGNYVVTKYVTGAEIKEALENGVSAYPETLGGFPQVSGITFRFDASKKAGNRVISVKIKGKDLDLKKKYLLATNDFMAKGGDMYTMFADNEIVNEYESLEEIIINFLKEHETIAPKVEGRIETLQASTDAVAVQDQKDKDAKTSKTENSRVTSKVYVVKKGDCLTKISKKLFGKESFWQSIYEYNKELIKNPDLIYPGMSLKIPE